MRAQLPHAIPNVEQPGNAGADGGADDPDPQPRLRPFEQNPEHNRHLQHSRGFAEQPWPDKDLADRHLDHDQAGQQQRIAPDDGTGEPKWNGFQVRMMLEAQNHDAGNQQQLIGQRIENRAQLAALIVPPSDVAIHSVADGGDGEGENAQQSMPLVASLHIIKDLNHEEGNQQNSQNGDLVRGGHAVTGSFGGRQEMSISCTSRRGNYRGKNRAEHAKEM